MEKGAKIKVMAKYSKYTNTENIREARRKKNVTVNTLRDVLGYTSRVSYYNLENGKVEPKISQMIILSEVLDEPINHFFAL